MQLERMIKEAPLWRPCSFPNSSRSIVIVCYKDDLPHVPNMVGNNHLLVCKAILVINHNTDTPQETKFCTGGTEKTVPNLSLQNITTFMDADIVFLSHNYDYHKLVGGSGHINNYGFKSFFVFMPIPYNAGITTTHLPNYYKENREDLTTVFHSLEDEESKKVFTSRIRALITGNIGYIHLSSFSEYYHPKVHPIEGDVIIDGGMSSYIAPQLDFLKSIGDGGQLYGFEPDPIGFISAHDQIKDREDCKNFQLIPFGLWSKKTTVRFNSAGSGSHVSNKDDGVIISCKMTTVDDFVKDYKLKKVSFIKLDVEGAEFHVLRSAIKTLVRFKPRLAISLYHLPEDLFNIPIFLKKILPSSKFYLGHHHASLHETILYVLPD